MGGRGEWVLLVWFAPSFPLGSGAKPVCPSSREDCVKLFTRQALPVVWTSWCYPLLFRSNPIIIRQGHPPDGPRMHRCYWKGVGRLLGPSPLTYQLESVYQTN